MCGNKSMIQGSILISDEFIIQNKPLLGAAFLSQSANAIIILLERLSER